MIELDGYRPGALAGIVALHMAYYARQWRFGLPFETKIASEMAEFLLRMQSADLFLVAYDDGTPVASIVVDASDDSEAAHLRWFIVGEAARGQGLGDKLLGRAVGHCDREGCPSIWLTTFAGLDAARHLYERHGFVLTQESDVDQWRGGVREQRFERRLPARPEA
jgi:GNAT superfamily N-acetyltransferase